MSILDEYGIERDPRFERATKEAKVVISFGISWIVFCIIVMYWGSITYDPRSPGVFGIPTYFFVILVGSVAIIIIGAGISLYYIEDTSLDAWRR